MTENYEITNDQLRSTLLKAPENRSYDDLLLIKSFMMKTEFVMKNLAGLINPKQMNDLCRQLGLEMYNENSVVFHQGEIGDKVFILLEGSVDLRVRYKLNLTQGESELREKFIKTYEERGSCFGERALQNHEPRSGTIVANTLTSLITISKDTYESILREARMDATKASEGLSIETLGTKEAVIRVLSKMRDKRTNQELDGVASYLHHRIPFFQKFSMPQLVELCRVAELVTSWTRSILFRQGTIGQAFYVVLGGNVEVWVNNGSTTQVPHTTHHHQSGTTGGNGRHIATKQHDITEGLGTKVNQLITGEIFGERALENEDSTRMASIVTCEGSTDLIVISREDYHNLVYVMMHSDSLSRISLLRKTDLFRSVDVVHLKGLSKFMEPKKYQYNEPLYRSGSKAIEIIIIESGECRVETEIREGKEEDFKELFQKEIFHDISRSTSIGKLKRVNTSSTENVMNESSTLSNHIDSSTLPDINNNNNNNNSLHKPSISISRSFTSRSVVNTPNKSTKVNLGRIGPNAVLGTYITSLSLSDDVFHPESVIASSLVTAYTIGKHDYYNHLNKDTRVVIDKLIASYQKPLLGFLWQNIPKVLDEDVWKKDQAWKKFKAELMLNPKRQANIMDSYRKTTQLHLTANSGNGSNTTINQRNLEIIKVREALDHSKQTTVDMSWGLSIIRDHNVVLVNDGLVTGNDDIESLGEELLPNTGIIPQNNKTITTISKNKNKTSKSPISSPNTKQHNITIAANSKSNHKHNDVGSHMTTAELLVASGDVKGNPNHHIVSSAVSNMIRNRINNSNYHQNLLKKELFPIHTQETLTTSNHSAVIEHNLQTNTLMDDTTSTTSNTTTTVGFVLVQLHRESAKNNVHGGLLDGAKRLVRCYLRICGTCPTAEAAKSLADIQMENIFLTLFKSDKTKEHELLLKWTLFKGFDHISLTDTDHFLIYCRSAPIMYASVATSKNIFNCLFPAICKQANQRFACIVTNKLKTTISNTKKDSIQTPDNNELDSDSDFSDKDMNSSSSKKKNSNNSKQLNKNNQNKINLKKIDTAATKSEKSVAINNFSPVQQITQPIVNNNNNNEYIQEFAVVYEVLKTTSTKLACLKYALNRFGTLLNHNNMIDNNIIDNIETDEIGFLTLPSINKNKNIINDDDIKKNIKKNVNLKSSFENSKDRILIELIKGDKIVCIVPLFNWILVNIDTMQALDFTNCFNEKSQEMLFIQEEIEHSRLVASVNNNNTIAIGSSASVIGGLGKISSNDHHPIDLSSNLYKAFAEVGLLKSEKIQEHINNENTNYIIHKETTPLKINTMIASQSLKILENEINAKELSRNIKSSSVTVASIRSTTNNNKTIKNNHIQLEKSNSKRDLMHRNSILTTATALTTNTDVTSNSNNNNNNNNHNNLERSEILLEKRLDTLNRTASAQLKILNEHNKLCDVEHKAFTQSFQEQQQQEEYQLYHSNNNNNNHNNNKSNNNNNNNTHQEQSNRQTGRLIDNRMNIIEQLQKLRFEKLTLDSVVTNYNSHRHKFTLADELKSTSDTTGVSSDDHLLNSPSNNSKYKTKSKHNNNIITNSSNIGNTSTVGTAGKRLAENIALLSETLNNKKLNY